jgi:glycosyltransferase involved in cell wall biosynthesis
MGEMAPRSPGVSVCLIVKDEEQLLPDALYSIDPIADEIVVAVDSRTTDRTREIAQEFGAYVEDFDWQDDFSKARNFSLSKATMDWVLVIDADDRVTTFGRQVIPQCLRKPHPGAEGYRLHIAEYTMAGEFIFEDVSPVRLFPRLGRAYVHRVHEQVYVDGRAPALIGSIDGGISIAHVGYDPAHYLARHKDERNMALLLKALEDDPTDFYSAYFLAKQHHEMGRDDQSAQAARIALTLLPAGAYTDDAELEMKFLATQP